ncbi:MAG: hypothetical protein ACYCVD_09325 [Desulfitobacteriaceae bacterium]
MLDKNPLYLANEEKIILIVDPLHAEEVVHFLQGFPEGEKAAILGEVRTGKGRVFLDTPLGGTRLVDMLAGAPLPRIC